jgi:RNA polymerase sigma-70 factor
MMTKDKIQQAREVFEILVRENQAMLMTYLRAVVRDAAVGEDLFQETMLIAWQKLNEYDRTRPFGPWLRGIAAKLVLAHFRKAKSDILLFGDETLEYLSGQVQHISERPGDTWDEKIAAITHCLGSLAEHYRHAIDLRYFKQTPAADIATASNTSVETIKKRLQRARALLLDCLRRRNVVMETTA